MKILSLFIKYNCDIKELSLTVDSAITSGVAGDADIWILGNSGDVVLSDYVDQLPEQFKIYALKAEESFFDGVNKLRSGITSEYFMMISAGNLIIENPVNALQANTEQIPVILLRSVTAGAKLQKNTNTDKLIKYPLNTLAGMQRIPLNVEHAIFHAQATATLSFPGFIEVFENGVEAFFLQAAYISDQVLFARNVTIQNKLNPEAQAKCSQQWYLETFEQLFPWIQNYFIEHFGTIPPYVQLRTVCQLKRRFIHNQNDDQPFLEEDALNSFFAGCSKTLQNVDDRYIAVQKYKNDTYSVSIALQNALMKLKYGNTSALRYELRYSEPANKNVAVVCNHNLPLVATNLPKVVWSGARLEDETLLLDFSLSSVLMGSDISLHAYWGSTEIPLEPSAGNYEIRFFNETFYRNCKFQICLTPEQLIDGSSLNFTAVQNLLSYPLQISKSAVVSESIINHKGLGYLSIGDYLLNYNNSKITVYEIAKHNALDVKLKCHKAASWFKDKCKKCLKTVKRLIKVALCWTYYRKEKIQPNRIFVMTYDNAYSCNERYIVDEIIRRELPVEIIWAYAGKRSLKTFPAQVRPVARGSLKMCIYQMTSKIWLDNALNCVWYYVPKRKGQIFLNTWHGSMGIKKLSGNKHWLRRAYACGKVTDYCITNSKFEEEVFRSTFWPKTPFLTFGHARNDLLFKPDVTAQIRARVARQLNISMDTNWLLYAPTFRDSGDTTCFNVDFELLKQTLETRFPGKWNILVRMHFKNRKISGSFNYNEWLIDASTYPDMQELMAVVDAGITDYSSWAYDYILTKRPLFLYVPDLENYDQARGFFYPLESTPFPMAKNNQELADAILHFDETQYPANIDAFLKDKGCYENGDAAKKIVDFLEDTMFG